MAEDYEFQVSAKELDYLKQLASRDESFARLLKLSDAEPHRKIIMRLSRIETEQLIEYLTTQLAVVGFDANYVPNERGQMLESLINKFYLP